MIRRILFLILMYAIPGISQYHIQFDTPISAWIFPDLESDKVFVDSLQLDFRFSGYGVYIESEYPVLKQIPLETGENIDLESIQWAEFTGERVTWKQFVPPVDRINYDDIDPDGYRLWSQIEIRCKIKDRFGHLLTSRIKRPDLSDIYLTGKTQRGEYELQLDQENGKTVRIIMDEGIFIQCSKNPAHRFRNMGWNYCPLCGSLLIKQQQSMGN